MEEFFVKYDLYIVCGLSILSLILIVLGIVLLVRRKKSLKKSEFAVPHRIAELPLKFEKAKEQRWEHHTVGRPILRSERDKSAREADFPKLRESSSRFISTPYTPAESARPVAPYTGWDRPERQSAAPVTSPASAPAPAVFPAPSPAASAPAVFPAPSPAASAPAVSPAPATSPAPSPAASAPAVSHAPVTSPASAPAPAVSPAPATSPASAPAPAPSSALAPEDRLLLLKTHELLLTLTDGLKKLSNAKTDTARKEKIGEMLAAVKQLDAKHEWDNYKNLFDKFNPEFRRRIEARAVEAVNPLELRLCALLAMGMGTKEIAELTNRSVRTVETSVYKIRKKLNIDAEEKTQDYLKNLL